MLDLFKRIELLDRLGKYMLSFDEEWKDAEMRALQANSWFTGTSITLAVENIAYQYLQKDKLETWASQYQLPTEKVKVGITMAGNIPLVGFHDLLCGFMSGQHLLLKLSSKDEVLIRHLIKKLIEWEPEVAKQIQIADIIKGCDAYIATGSNNTARYFEQYFGKYPHIIRKNRTSVAILDGAETDDDLNKLADDVFNYYGLGCRNVTQVCVPRNYDFTKLLEAFKRYDEYMLHHKYKHNYDYYLAIYLLNKVPYLTNESLLMVENELPFSAVSVLHYRYYDDKKELVDSLQKRDDIQAVIGQGFVPFGSSQKPALNDYADGVDTMSFLCSIRKS